MAYNKEEKLSVEYGNAGKEQDSWGIHLFPALLCEDGTYLLQEDGNKINLEWYHKRTTKTSDSFSIGEKSETVWTK
jgi:hypothetical protein